MISVRFEKKSQVPCPAREDVIQRFASRFGIMPSGAASERRFRHETTQVAIRGKIVGAAVMIDVVQR